MALPDPNKGKHGTVYIQSGAWNYPNYPLDVLQGAYIHEYGNILSYKYGGGNFNKFGDKAGIGTNYKDKDTGANFQKMYLSVEHSLVRDKLAFATIMRVL